MIEQLPDDYFVPQPSKRDSPAWVHLKKQFPDSDLSQFKEKDGNILHLPTGEVLYRQGKLQTKTLRHIVAPPPPFPEAYLETLLQYPPYTPQREGGFSQLVTHLEIPVGSKRFKITVRDLFKEATITHTSGKETRHWLAGPDIKYWPQQLNFAVWAATEGCGVALDMFNTAFLRFHVAFTMRRVLKELDVPLPGDRAFHQTDNPFDRVTWERLKNEFKLKTPDFRNREGTAHGLGETYVWSGGAWIQRPGMGYPSEWEFSDLGGKADQGTLIYYIRNSDKNPLGTLYCYERIRLKNLARLNRSIEAFVYCILGAQVNTRSPIVSGHGASQETQQEFLTLFESAVIENDISKIVQRYQLAVQQSKVSLDYALSPGCWLMPSH